MIVNVTYLVPLVAQVDTQTGTVEWVVRWRNDAGDTPVAVTWQDRNGRNVSRRLAEAAELLAEADESWPEEPVEGLFA